MPEAELQAVVVFDTTSAAIKADKAVRRSGLDAKLIPTPRHLSSDCGLALRFLRSDKDRMGTVLSEAGIEPAGIHDL